MRDGPVDAVECDVMANDLLSPVTAFAGAGVVVVVVVEPRMPTGGLERLQAFRGRFTGRLGPPSGLLTAGTGSPCQVR